MHYEEVDKNSPTWFMSEICVWLSFPNTTLLILWSISSLHMHPNIAYLLDSPDSSNTFNVFKIFVKSFAYAILSIVWYRNCNSLHFNILHTVPHSSSLSSQKVLFVFFLCHHRDRGKLNLLQNKVCLSALANYIILDFTFEPSLDLATNTQYA